MDAYREAQRLYAETLSSGTAGPERLPVLEEALQQIGALVPEALPDVRPALLLMTSALAEQIAGLREETR